MRFIFLMFLFCMASGLPVFAQAETRGAHLPDLKELKLQRSTYPATLTGDCAYVDDQYSMDCSFFVSRVAAKRSDGRVNDMLLRMYKDRSAAEWKEHPICTAPEVRDMERHIRVMKVQKKISKTEEDMIRREFGPAVAFCADPTLPKYKAYLQGLAEAVSCSISTSVERVKMRFDKENQSWTGVFTPKSDRKPITEYTVKLDSVTGQVGQRLIFMVTQTLRPRGGGRPQQLIYRAKRADQKHFCGYVEW
ncbi:MAG: hypothetical protein HWE25_03025 [Alphaproteobacteria bacterium]|nr:hypothetical protein [Alphaproteobacteria bacterium]